MRRRRAGAPAVGHTIGATLLQRRVRYRVRCLKHPPPLSLSIAGHKALSQVPLSLEIMPQNTPGKIIRHQEQPIFANGSSFHVTRTRLSR